MALFDFFDKGAAIKRKREASLKKLTNMYYQKVDRLAAAEQAARLAREGDLDSIAVLLKRFEHLAPNHTADREEKEYVHDLLIDLGSVAIAPIEDYIRKTETPVWWAVQAYAGIVPKARVSDLLSEVLEASDNGYVRHPAKKAGLVQMSADWLSERLKTAVAPFLDDHEEPIRFDAVQTLLRQPDGQTPVRLAPKLLPSEESARVRTAVAEAFAAAEWPVPATVDLDNSRLPSGFVLDDARRVTKRTVNPRESMTLAALRDSLTR
jgi:hypothetical protein